MATRPNNIVAFPAEVLADQKVRQCERMVKKLLGWIEDAERFPNDRVLQIHAATAGPMLEMWSDDLKAAKIKRELLNAGDTMRHGGMIYRAQPSQNGAH
ncbi:hypothetical protein [Sphingobium sp. YR768]|uniref:hypothetical protein n=1 Tax=Sphingobium sp. YR768 TaxID=1884365 RepID=UPI0008BE11B4|nr:hypothetical protein [Sphingobium sp. YR768]SES08752.1 hypothetical protein SAMN05518866_13750 [Sphingobium sp. YR768]